MKTKSQHRKDLWIIVIGRSNIAKSSQSLDLMIKRLRASGFGVQGLEPRSLQTSRLMDRWFNTVLGGRFARFCRKHKTFGGALRKAAKAFWLAGHPSRWDFSRFSRATRTQNEERAKDLQTLLRDWRVRYPSRQVHLFAHSAGGIVASWLEQEPNVASIACFGYPFKHPRLNEEPFRTAHLEGIRKPFLIIQGSRDAYGNVEAATRYPLSPNIRLFPIKANHNYDRLKPRLFVRCLRQVSRHFRQAARPR